jgi:hypothetical protein
VVAVAAVVLPAAAAVLYTYPPGEGSFYPPCLFHIVTGLHCPGCGGTRCAHALLHGDLPQALAWNPLLVVSLPFVAAFFISAVYRSWTGRRLPVRRLPGWATYLTLGIIIAFWVLRNIDIYPLTLLAPHKL